MYNISEQQINPKVLSVANGQKSQKSFQEKCLPLESYPNKSPWAKAGMQMLHVGGKFLVQSPGVREGDGYGKNRQLHKLFGDYTVWGDMD